MAKQLGPKGKGECRRHKVRHEVMEVAEGLGAALPDPGLYRLLIEPDNDTMKVSILEALPNKSQ